MQFLEEANVDGGEEAPEPVSADLLASLEAALDADEFPSELDLASVYAAVADLIAFLPLDKHFPVLDVWRLLVLREDCNAHYAADESVATYITGLFGPGAADGDGPSKAGRWLRACACAWFYDFASPIFFFFFFFLRLYCAPFLVHLASTHAA